MRVSATIICLLFLILSNYSCNNKPQAPSLDTIAGDFAPLECRAMTLREQRFALANQIRFTQDTLLRFANKADTTKLKLKLDALNAEKERMTQQSLQLADTVKYTLDSLMSHYLTAKEDKDKFNQLLNNKLDSMHCKGSSPADM